MNLWDRSLALLGKLLIPIALFLCACEADSDLGSEILNINSDSIETRVVSIPLDITMQRVDTVITNNNPAFNSFYSVGKTEDPVLGEIRATTFAQLSSFQDGITDLTDSDSFVSAKLILIQNDFVFGPQEAEQEVRVREILEPIAPLDENLGTLFDRRQEFEVAEDFIGQSFIDLVDDSLFIEIDSIYGAELFELIRSNRSEVANNQQSFNALINGISIEGGEINTAIFEINSNRSTSFLELTYLQASDSAENTLALFLETASDATNNSSLGFTQVLFDETNPLINNILSQPERTDFEPLNNTVVYNSLLGVFPKIDFSNFCDWIEMESNIIINNVSFRIGIDGRDLEVFPISNIQLSVSDSSGMISDLNTVISGGFVNSDVGNVNLGFDSNESEYVHSSTVYFEINVDCDSLDSNFNSAFILSSFGIANERFFDLNLRNFTANQNDIFLEVIYTTLGN